MLENFSESGLNPAVMGQQTDMSSSNGLQQVPPGQQQGQPGVQQHLQPGGVAKKASLPASAVSSQQQAAAAKLHRGGTSYRADALERIKQQLHEDQVGLDSWKISYGQFKTVERHTVLQNMTIYVGT